MGGWAVGRFVTARLVAVRASDQSEFGAHLLEGPQGEVQIIAGVCCGQLAPYACMPWRDNGIAESGNEHALRQQQLAHVNRFCCLAKDHGHDRRLSWER